MCIEDKLFPKTNSLLNDRKQPLADRKEFAMKIQVITGYEIYLKQFILHSFQLTRIEMLLINCSLALWLSIL